MNLLSYDCVNVLHRPSDSVLANRKKKSFKLLRIDSRGKGYVHCLRGLRFKS